MADPQWNSADRMERTWRDRGLSTRAVNALIRTNCSDVADVRRLGFLGIQSCRSIGNRTAAEIWRVLFAEEPPEDPYSRPAIRAAKTVRRIAAESGLDPERLAYRVSTLLRRGANG